LDILTKLGQKYSFVSAFDQVYRILTITTKDSSLITLIDSKNIPSIVKTTVTVTEYDDSKTVTDIEGIILTNGDTSSLRPEAINNYKSVLSVLQNQAKNLNISNWQTMKISDLQTAINSALPKN